MVTTGQKAPDFIAPAITRGQPEMLEFFSLLNQHRGAVLLFAPADFVPVVTAEWAAVRDAGWADVPGLAVVALSGDSLYSHAAYADRFDFPFTIVSDFHGTVAEIYELALEEWEGHDHVPARATVVIDGNWSVAFDEAVDPLGQITPAPVEQATEHLQGLGFDVEKPEVDYDQYAGDL